MASSSHADADESLVEQEQGVTTKRGPNYIADQRRDKVILARGPTSKRSNRIGKYKGSNTTSFGNRTRLENRQIQEIRESIQEQKPLNLPSRINRYLRKSRSLELTKSRTPLNLKKIKRARINIEKSKNGYLVYPQLYNGKWWPFEYNGQCLSAKVPNMVGNLSHNKAMKLVSDWTKWLKNWIKDNNLRIAIDNSELPSKEVVEKIKKQPRWLREYINWAGKNKSFKHDPPRSLNQWNHLKRQIHVSLQPNLNASSDSKISRPVLSEDSLSSPE